MTENQLLQTRRGAIAAALAAASGAAAIATAARAAAQAGAVTTADPTGFTGDAHDFDYHIGDWTMANRRLKKRWVSNPEWDEFPGTDRYVKYLGGIVNVDEAVFPTKGFSGLSIRVFDPGRRLWSEYWINASTSGTPLAPPMVGGFRGDHGLFYGDDVDDGQPVKVRFIRTKQPPDKDRWEQAFSRDGGVTWETNWTTDFTRVRS